ncbi:hypothetical protein KDA_69430 [Dictyobacter alpinus]|uniref:Uncharacterized protein n=1 Tax=Dictyobacter alpinus TaxID=2014873 RepID=A0A402BJD6_9CHLR|nr:hypothetical protein [Dictyobacter alpinus]GCE31459.1 hypothetical protein KDA_69430 [Dictyobacter alpinus]
MQNATKRVDPIWRHVWTNRIWKFLWLIYTIGYLIFLVVTHVWEKQGLSSMLLAAFNLLVAVGIIVNEFKQEAYWKRLGTRRSEALQDPTSFRARNQPIGPELALQLPVTIRLHFNQTFTIVATGMILTLFVVSAGLGVYLASGSLTDWFPALIVLAIFIGMLLIAFLFIYFFWLRYQTQSIELNEEGITTRYQSQKRSIRWEDAQIFAQYEQGGFNRKVNGTTFELANQETVVRWSQQRFNATYLKVNSNQARNDDFNWLLSQVKAYVAQRTRLPLLDFNDTQSAGRGSQTDQNDPLAPHLSLNKQQLWTFSIAGIFGIGLILMALFGNTFPGTQSGFKSAGNVLNAMWLLGGGMMVLGIGTTLVTYRIARRYWLRQQKQRELSKQTPERFRASIQPQPVSTPPQPGKLDVKISPLYLFSVTFISLLVISFLLVEVIFRQTGLYLLYILLGCMLLSLFSAITTVALSGKRYQRRIEVWPNGITSRISIMESQINWQDVTSFIRYRGLRIIPGQSKIQIYELTGDNTVVRWQWPHNQLRFQKTDPTMTPKEHDRWMEHLSGYIVERTGLPLLDLDEEQH